jgi:hypothetical protein
MTENRSSKAKYFWIVLLTVTVATPIGLLILFGVGQNSGREFSPDDFSRRSFQYNQVPGLDWVLFKKTYTDVTTVLEQDLVADKLVKPVINKTKTWHLIWDSGDRDGLPSDQCDARFLTAYLDMSDDEGNNYWTPWNEKFPKCAKVFWPRVADLARDEMYLKIPDVMRVAMEVDSDQPDQFLPILDRLSAKIYLELGSLDLEMDRLERARLRLDRSIQILPSREAYQCRSDCLARMGQELESGLDLEKAQSAPEISVDSSLDEGHE